MNSEKPSSAERLGAGFRNVQKYAILEYVNRLETKQAVLISYLRGRKFPGTVRLRKSQDHEFEKMNIASTELERNTENKTNAGSSLSNLPIEFEEQVI